MQIKKHTATPWVQGEGAYIEGISQAGGCTIADCETFSGRSILSQHERDANAAFIVRAVNAHNALVEAIESGLHHGRLQTFEDRERWRAQARAALKLAKEGK